MYVRTNDGLGEVQPPYGFFADAPAATPFEPAIREFLNRVRKRPQDFKQLLLTVTFHPLPLLSQAKVTIGKAQPAFLQDVQLIYNLEPPVVFLDALRRIRDDFRKRDARFRQEIEAELQLRNQMIKTAGDLGPEKLKPHLLEPILTDDFSIFHYKVGLSFAQKMLPPSLAQRIINSAASDAHLTHLGKFLRRYAEVLQTKNPAFKALVERERKRRQQVNEEEERKRKLEEEQKKRQKRRGRP